MKILLTGKNGQVGFELQRALSPVGEVYAVDSGDCNLADENGLRALVRTYAPDVIVNPAAYTAVDRAETEPEMAHAVNAIAPTILAQEAEKLGARMIHYSTDYVFDGEKPAPYVETDEPAPVGAYGRSKLDGERGIISTMGRHLILRTCWVMGAHGHNFAKTMLRVARDQESLRVVNDQWGAPTSAALIADVTSHLVLQMSRDGDRFPFGLYHLSARGQTNWYEYACRVLESAAAAGIPLRTNASAVQAISSSEYRTPARRPKNSILDTTLFRSTFGLSLPEWQDGLDHTLQELLSKS